jgi:hypothetical protein
MHGWTTDGAAEEHTPSTNMILYQCDLCGKDITMANDVVKVGVRSYGFLASEFCADCGKPVVMFLKRVEKKLKSRNKHPAPA